LGLWGFGGGDDFSFSVDEGEEKHLKETAKDGVGTLPSAVYREKIRKKNAKLVWL